MIHHHGNLNTFVCFDRYCRFAAYYLSRAFGSSFKLLCRRRCETT